MIFHVFSTHEYGAVDSWTWNATLRRNEDGSYKADLFQTATDGNQEDCFEPSTLESFTDGADFFDFLNSNWRESHESYLSPEQWSEIVVELAKASPLLAAQVTEALRSEMDGLA